MSEPVKKLQWGYTGMIPFSETAEKLGLHAYVQIENYQFMQKRADNLESDNARLKAEVERLRHLEGVASSVDFYQQENEKLNEEIERLTMIKDACKRMIKRRDKRIFELKAELAHLRASSFVTAVPVEEYEKLQAEVERLTKSHSDALADFWAIHKGYFDLKAEVEQLRKEGKRL